MFLATFVEDKDNGKDGDKGGKNVDHKADGEEPKEGTGSDDGTCGAVDEIEISTVASPAPFLVPGGGKVAGSFRENIAGVNTDFGNFGIDGAVDGDVTFGINMAIGKTFNGTGEINWSLLGEIGGGEFGDVGFFGDRAADSDVKKGADSLGDNVTGGFEVAGFDVGIGSVGNHGVVTAGKSCQRDFDGNVDCLDVTSVDRNLFGGLNPVLERPSITGFGGDGNRGALIIDNNKVFNSDGIVLSFGGVVADFKGGGKGLARVTFELQLGRNGGDGHFFSGDYR